ncbi:TetR/AcrR family transcriptional regulator [uncultured Desulfuromonas sp.]|uniref:TetR/AcrR family transcriptional regulator n=1 Tax=uncultured Desulfuromonas sp. TaxID=181013 RepID=UPI002AAB2DBA|nr:TetR/AcrR family transcriptional regulator [uncultured Desulfuromonas sp.]
MKKIEQNKIQKRDRILKAAQETFQASGFIGASMDRIAEKAGVTKQTVYRYFTTKEELFKATLEAQRRLAKESFLDALQLSDTRQALTTFAAGFIKRHLSREHLANVRLLVAEGPSVPEMTRAFYAFGSEKTQDSLVRFIEDRFDRKDAVDEIQAFVSMLISLRMPVLTGLREPLSEEEITRHADKTVRMFLKLLDATI